MTSFPGSGPPPAPAPHLAPPADVADARALRDAGGALLPGGDGVTVSGWDIRTRRTPILGKEALAGLEARLGTPHLPEMVYGSVLELTHAASDTRVHFNAEDALREWLEEDLPPLKVAAAAKWAEAHKLRFGGGLPPSKAAGPGSRAPVPAAAWDTNEDASAYDWTFTTPYRGSVGTVSGSNPEGTGAKNIKRWAETSRRVDRGALMERDPILFFDELTLYESELDDNGESSVTLKIRVMPKCWFVLMRFWMRCDGVRVRLRETRFLSDGILRGGGGGETDGDSREREAGRVVRGVKSARRAGGRESVPRRGRSRGRAARRGGTGGDGVPRNRARVRRTRDVGLSTENANYTTPASSPRTSISVPV